MPVILRSDIQSGITKIEYFLTELSKFISLLQCELEL